MKSMSPRSISWWIAGPIAFIFLCIMIAISFDWFQIKWPLIALMTAAVLALSFYLSHYLVKSFISLKIKPIYKVIRKTKGSVPLKKEKKKLDNPMGTINNDVDNWAHDKNIEIKRLKANAKFRQEFIGNVGHELKTPIFNIQGYILTLLEGGLEDPNINRLYLERAEKSVDRMIQIIKDLENIAHIESGELVLNYTEFDLIKLVEEVFDLQEMRAKSASIELKLSRRIDKPVMVMADRTRILEVLSNLVVNGIVYGRPNGSVAVDLLDMDKHILIEVADDGIGIKKEDQNRVFERFYRVDKSRSRDQGGTGLGLAIAKHFTEAHGHTINMKSKVGKGTSFTFMLKKS